MHRARRSRRRCLATLAALALPWRARAQFAVDGPALVRALAAKSLLLDVAQAGSRLVAVGERGHVLLSDDEGGRWRQAAAVPTRATLTALHAVDARTLLAVGHGGVVLRSIDAGEHWSLIAGRADATEVLLAVHVEPDGRGLAVGGFGFALRSADGGASWKRAELVDGEAGERHCNRIFVSARSTWLIAAEGGLLLRSEDRGEHWQALKTPYAGSLWGGARLAGGALLACGMRGNVLRSTDDGLAWTHQAIAGAGSLTAIAPLKDGRCVIVGVDGTLLRGSTGGERFVLQRLEDRTTLTGVVALASGALVVTGTNGVRLLKALT